MTCIRGRKARATAILYDVVFCVALCSGSDFVFADVLSTSVTTGNGASSELQEVVVTAEKRSERLQDVPVPVTALNAEALTSAGQLHLQDYYDQVPSVTVQDGVQSSLSVTIRGLPAGAFTLDDVPIVGVLPDIDPGNLAQIEVLRGPQGTLYGANSLGGMIKFVTQDPSTSSVTGRVEVGASSVYNGYDNGYSFRGSINLPISDTLAVRAGAFTRQDPGYIDNSVLHIDGINRDEAHGGQVTGLWRPSDQFSVRLTALYQAITGGLNQVHLYSPTTGAPLGDLQQDYVAATGPYDRTFSSLGAVLKYKFGNAELTSVTGYSVNKANDYWDVSGPLTPYSFSLIAQQNFGETGVSAYEHHRDTPFTEEVRLTTPIGPKFDGLLGLFYSNDSPGTFTAHFPVSNPTTGAVVGSLINFSSFGSATREKAVFADVTYHPIERLDIQLGGRAAHDNGGASPYYISAGPYTVAAIGEPPGTPYIAPATHQDANAVTYLLTPRLKLSTDLMVYVRVASGFLPGGPNVPGPGIPPDFGPEKTKNYEIGLKGSFLENRLSIDTSAYYIDFVGLQQNFYNTTTHETYLANAGAAKSQGLEFNVEGRPLNGLKLAGWITIADAKLTSEATGVLLAEEQNGGITTSVGDRLPNSARFSGNVSADQSFPISGSLTGNVGANVSYVGNRLGPYATGASRQYYPAYTKTDVHCALKFDTWNFNLFVNNVTDRRGIVSGDAEGVQDFSRFIIQPRLVGLTVSKTF